MHSLGRKPNQWPSDAAIAWPCRCRGLVPNDAVWQPPASYRASHTCTVLRATPNRAATSVTVSPSAITARTASYRCSTTDIALMNQECHQSTEVGVTHHPKHRHHTTEGRMGGINRSNTRGWSRGWSRLGDSNSRPTHYESFQCTPGASMSIQKPCISGPLDGGGCVGTAVN
jgi:hypothetical protein